MRNVESMTVGDQVVLMLGGTPIAATYQGHTPWGVTTSWGGFEAYTPFDSEVSWVEDQFGHTLGVPVSEPLLVGGPPDLE